MRKSNSNNLVRITGRRELKNVQRACRWLLYSDRKHVAPFKFAELAKVLTTSTARLSHIANGRWEQVRLLNVEAAVIVALAIVKRNEHKADDYELRELEQGQRKLVAAMRHFDNVARSIARRRTAQKGKR